MKLSSNQTSFKGAQPKLNKVEKVLLENLRTKTALVDFSSETTSKTDALTIKQGLPKFTEGIYTIVREHPHQGEDTLNKLIQKLDNFLKNPKDEHTQKFIKFVQEKTNLKIPEALKELPPPTEQRLPKGRIHPLDMAIRYFNIARHPNFHLSRADFSEGYNHFLKKEKAEHKSIELIDHIWQQPAFEKVRTEIKEIGTLLKHRLNPIGHNDSGKKVISHARRELGLLFKPTADERTNNVLYNMTKYMVQNSKTKPTHGVDINDFRQYTSEPKVDGSVLFDDKFSDETKITYNPITAKYNLSEHNHSKILDTVEHESGHLAHYNDSPEHFIELEKKRFIDFLPEKQLNAVNKFINAKKTQLFTSQLEDLKKSSEKLEKSLQTIPDEKIPQEIKQELSEQNKEIQTLSAENLEKKRKLLFKNRKTLDFISSKINPFKNLKTALIISSQQDKTMGLLLRAQQFETASQKGSTFLKGFIESSQLHKKEVITKLGLTKTDLKHIAEADETLQTLHYDTLNHFGNDNPKEQVPQSQLRYALTNPIEFVAVHHTFNGKPSSTIAELLEKFKAPPKPHIKDPIREVLRKGNYQDELNMHPVGDFERLKENADKRTQKVKEFFKMQE